MIVGDVGTVIEINVGVEDITDATVMRIYYKKPSGVEGYWNATAVAPSSIRYVTQEGDIDEGGDVLKGKWTFQPYIEIPGWSGRGTEFTKQVSLPI